MKFEYNHLRAKQATVLTALVLLLSACSANTNLVSDPRTVAIDAGATPAAAVLRPNMASLLQRTSPSYVTVIVNENKRAPTKSHDDTLPKALTSGSGFLIDPAGYVLTAGHVAVRVGNTVDARGNDGRIYAGRVVAVQKSPDIALIRLKDFTGIPVTPAGNTCVTPGSAVFSLGKPHAKGDTARIGQLHSMSFGRPVSYSGFGYPDAMVVRMSTKKGESGGPLFNANARLVGMMVSTLSDGKGHSLNLAHALPMNMLAKFACSKFACSQQWRQLANTSQVSCK